MMELAAALRAMRLMETGAVPTTVVTLSWATFASAVGLCDNLSRELRAAAGEDTATAATAPAPAVVAATGGVGGANRGGGGEKKGMKTDGGVVLTFDI